MAAQSNAQQTFEELVAAVKQAESRGKRYAADGKTLTTSPKGALGEMQVMPKTIKDPGFGVIPAKDASPDEIARVGVDYLQAMTQKYGDTEKALIAYNWGPGSTDKWIASGADPKKLPDETRTYVQRVKGFLGKDVSRETVAKKEREPLPASLPPMAEAPQTTPAKATTVAKLDMANMPASYKAAFALAALADAQDEEEDRAFNENKQTETETFFASYKPVNHLASLDLSVEPIAMKDGGDVKVEPTERKDEPFFDAASRTFVDVMTGRRTPITEKDFTAKEQLAMLDAVKRSQARGGKGRVDYQDYPDASTVGPGYVDIRNTLGGFQYKQMPDGSTVITDRYDFHGPRVAEYEKMGTGEKLVKSAKNALTEFVTKGFSPRDLAGELGRAYIGSKGPEVNIRIPVNRAEGSPEEGEQVKFSTQAQPVRGAAPQPPATRSAKELDAYIKAMNPGARISYFPENGDTLGHVSSKAQDILNIQRGLSPQRDEETKLHELEHSLTFRGGDPLGRPKIKAVDNNYQAYYMLGSWQPMSQFTKNMVENREKLEKFFGRPLNNAYFRPETLEVVKKQQGDTSALFDEQMASLSALEQITGKSLTRDPEMKKLFPSVKVMSVYDALTGPRQTRMDPRDLPPSTPQPAYSYRDNPVTQFLHKTFLNDNFYPYQKPVKRANGSPEEGEMSRPYIGNPNIRRQGEAARKLAAMRDVNTLPDPKTYAVTSGLLGTPPDQMGFSVMNPKYKEIMDAANPAFAAGTALQIAPALQALGVGKVPKIVGEGLNRKMLAGESLTPGLNTPAPINFAMKPKGGHFYVWPESSAAPEKSQVDAYLQMIENRMDKPNAAVADWVKSKVGRYIRSDFATEQDQMVRAAEEGKKLHFTTPRAMEESAPIIDPSVTIMRKTEGYPSQGFAKTEQGKLVENIVDSSVWPATLENTPTDYIPSSIRKFKDTDPNMRVYEFPDAVFEDNLKITNLANQMDKMMTEKTIKLWGQEVPVPKEYQLDVDTLKGLTPAQASNRVAMKEEWLAKKEPEIAGQMLAKDRHLVSHEYNNGSKWISPDDLADNDSHRELVTSVGCRGGWCTDKESFAFDYGSGDNRLHILLDKNAQPRAQLTMNSPQVRVRDFILANPDLPALEAMTLDRTLTKQRSDEMIRAMPEYQDFVKQNQGIKHITEIKGQFNKEDLTDQAYLKEVQDFIKRQGPELQSVENLDGIGMTDISSHIYPNKSFKAIATPGKKGIKDVYDEAIRVNGNSPYIENDPAVIDSVIEKAVKNVFTPKLNEARTIQMNLFQPPAEKAYGGMIERQPNDNRRYL
jgi:hypothetical protein